ncbi:MAG TPA: ABC transporter permease [Gaiellaceae bacterium]|nr:ABC transporter permease [Gaiellaceae bacterium]
MSTYAGGVDRVMRSRLLDPRSLGTLGILLGILAFILAIPPLTQRSVTWSLVCGILAVLFGIVAASRGARRVGGGAIAAAVIGVSLAELATRSSTGNLDQVFTASLIASMLVFATPLTFAALGGIFSERSGVVNIGLEGMMLMGSFWGIWGADKTGSWVWGIFIAMASGGLLALVLAFFAIHLRADQIVVGVAINFLALGITGYGFVQIYHGNNVPTGISQIPNINLAKDSSHSFFAQAFGQLNLLIWVGILFVVLTHIVLFKTPIGLRIRACGEHPRAADTVGINVYLVRYAAVTLSGMLAAMGGAYLTVGYLNTFNENVTAGRGFIALAAVIFGNWRPFGAWGAALLFGFSTALAFRLNVYSDQAATLFQALPYVLTLIAVAGVIGRTIPPAADGRPYKKQ